MKDNKFICHDVDHHVDVRTEQFRALHCSIHSARKVKTSSYNCITFLLCNPPNPSFLFFLSFFSSEASETKSQTGDWQSDWTPGEVFTLRQNLAGSPSWLCHYSCEASGKSVAASNGHRWRGVTSQVMCEYLVSLLHSFKGTKSTLRCTVAWQHKC